MTYELEQEIAKNIEASELNRLEIAQLYAQTAGERDAALKRLDRIADLLPPGDDPYDGTANTVIGPIARGEEA